MKQGIVNFILLVLILTLIGIMIYIAHFLKSESGECYTNPLVYGVQHMDDDLQSHGSCTCNLAGHYCICDPNRQPYLSFRVTKFGTEPIRTDSFFFGDPKPLNLSKLT